VKTRISKATLLDVLKQNREVHRSIVDEALKGYRKQAIKELDGMIAEAKSGRRIQRKLTLVEPMDQTQEYDRAIRKVEMSVDKTIALGDHEFEQLVMDEWDWKNQWSDANRSYTTRDI